MAWGLAISGGVAFVLLLIGVLGIMKKGTLSGYAKSLLGAIPFGNVKLWAILFIAAGLIFGGLGVGIGYGKTGIAMLSGAASTATITGTSEPATMESLTLSDCQINTYSASAAATVGNTTFRVDPNDNTHLYVDLDNVTNAGAASINGTVTCSRSGDPDKAAKARCEFRSGTYTSKTSSTDTGIYRMVALSSGASQVAGVASGFKQTAYLNDGSVATTSSRQEVTDWVFTGGSSAQVSDTLGFYFTLPGTTNINYLNKQDSVDNVIVCDGKQVAKFTVTKVDTKTA